MISSIRMASSWKRRRVLHIHIGDDLLISKGLPDTGGWTEWTTITIPDVYIPGGTEKVMRLYFDCVRMSINYLNFKKLQPSPLEKGSGLEPSQKTILETFLPRPNSRPQIL